MVVQQYAPTDPGLRLTDPTLYAHGDPHAVWAGLRRDCPVSWHDEPGHEGFWAVTTYAEGLDVLTDSRRFSSTRGTFLRPNLSDPFPGGGRMMTLTDPPRHGVLRGVLGRLFTPRASRSFQDRAKEVAHRLIGSVTDAGTCDFVNDVAARYPLAVTAELLGVAPGDVDRVASYTSTAADNIVDIDGSTAQQAHLEVLQYYSEVLEDRRSSPGDDVVSAFALAQAEGLDISDEEIILTCDNLVVAAGETTRQVTGAGLLALMDAPEQAEALRRGEISHRRAVEELLRWSAPVNHIMRTAVTDTEIAGVPIRAGQAVSVWLPSLNRDESVFERPMEFLLDRHPNRHASFGGGGHFCIGAPLARLMISALLDELVDERIEIALAGPPRRIPSYITGGLDRLPVTVTSR
ncbi:MULTISPECIES: cytochrome P450 [Streptomyces]|uniref:cytochrome P450 n=1 Tax=Streptomyces TaxID=1883 RepID=UPI000F54EAB9|nr:MULTISPECIES: cytochrome P450 [unclassified Streptomyces]MDX3063300.1 cytochrome P450 [Streptomyces sp. ND04-05B]RPK85461.1 Steroid C26-monooxygenase [Streptomyces sp. ADI97-07]